MSSQPDVLDLIGKPPREFGAVHVHFEAAHRNTSGEAEAVICLQAAFSRAGTGTISFHASETAPPLSRQELPALDDGRVVRVRFPLVLERPTALLFARVESERPQRGERIRPAWLLADTIEVPKQGLLDDIDALERFERRRNGGNDFESDDLRKLRQAARTEIHKARRLAPMLSVEVTPTAAELARKLEVELIWKPGAPLPAAAETFALAPPMTIEFRRCFTCHFEGSQEKYGNALSCPMCGTPWP